MPAASELKTAQGWVPIVREFGLPMLLLIGLSYVVWTAGAWLGNSVVIPVVERQIKFIDALDDSVKSIDQSVATIAAAVNEMTSEQERTTAQLKEISERLKNQ